MCSHMTQVFWTYKKLFPQYLVILTQLSPEIVYGSVPSIPIAAPLPSEVPERCQTRYEYRDLSFDRQSSRWSRCHFISNSNYKLYSIVKVQKYILMSPWAVGML